MIEDTRKKAYKSGLCTRHAYDAFLWLVLNKKNPYCPIALQGIALLHLPHPCGQVGFWLIWNILFKYEISTLVNIVTYEKLVVNTFFRFF